MIQFAPKVDPTLLKTLTLGQSVAAQIVDAAGKLAVNLVSAVLILLIAVWASRWVSGLIRRALGRLQGHHAPDATLISFIASLARYVILIVGLVAVLQQLGVQATSIVAVLGAASLAVGLAMQGALSNVAAGVMILLFRPYRVGDVIETGTKTGRVKSLDLFVTELSTLDNLKVVIPNSKVFGDVIVNHSTHERRRVDAVFRIPIAANLAAVSTGLINRAKADPRVYDEPQPKVEITSMAEVWVEGVIRAWVATPDHAAVKSDLLLAAHLLAADPKAVLPPLPDLPDVNTPLRPNLPGSKPRKPLMPRARRPGPR
ncbi:MAG: mechanosensitive ion channel protein MscS [Caulobacter sp.]|nr:mechanosensitive ion channel protein MscS [Caulobacter sp.]